MTHFTWVIAEKNFWLGKFESWPEPYTAAEAKEIGVGGMKDVLRNLINVRQRLLDIYPDPFTAANACMLLLIHQRFIGDTWEGTVWWVTFRDRGGFFKARVKQRVRHTRWGSGARWNKVLLWALYGKAQEWKKKNDMRFTIVVSLVQTFLKHISSLYQSVLRTHHQMKSWNAFKATIIEEFARAVSYSLYGDVAGCGLREAWKIVGKSPFQHPPAGMEI